MIVPKYTRGSAIHRTLELICMVPSTKEEMKLKITKESMPRFLEACINPLLAEKFIVKKGDVFHPTDAGQARLETLGFTKKHLPHRKNKNWIDKVAYTGEELTMKPIRPGADDHERCPSLVGDTRYWRDGRKEVSHE
jgi:hypothetical protein